MVGDNLIPILISARVHFLFVMETERGSANASTRFIHLEPPFEKKMLLSLISLLPLRILKTGKDFTERAYWIQILKDGKPDWVVTLV